MNDEVRETAHIKMRPSIVRLAYQKAKEQGQTLGRWLEEAIDERIEREQKKLKWKRPAVIGLSGVIR